MYMSGVIEERMTLTVEPFEHLDLLCLKGGQLSLKVVGWVSKLDI